MGGCCCCKQKDVTPAPPVHDQYQPLPPAAKPGLVQRLTVTVDSRRPTVTLTWDPPANGEDIVTAYEYCCRREERSIWSNLSSSGRLPQTYTVSDRTTNVRLTRDHGIVPLAHCTFKVRAVNVTVEGDWSAVRAFIDWKPEPVEDLTITQYNPTDVPCVQLNWSPPINMDSRYIEGYDIRFKVKANLYAYECSEFSMRQVSNTSTSLELTTPDVKPLTTYTFQVRAYTSYSEGEWCVGTKRIDWYCKFPGCTVNRRLLQDSSVSEFCHRKHAREYAAQYCLFPKCCNKTPNDFCDSHLEQAIQTGFSTVVDVPPDSKTFRGLCKQFRKDWASAKGNCPDVNRGVILRVVNPAVSVRFENYRKQELPWLRRSLEQYYHGTTQKCRIDDTLVFCKIPSCGVCGIASRGFDPERISKLDWQRFGGGFYLAPNSSKSHDYTSVDIHSIFQCDVAPGKKHKLEKNASHLQGPPEGCHSVYGRSSRRSPLNYDEIVLNNPAAIRPNYVFIYS